MTNKINVLFVLSLILIITGCFPMTFETAGVFIEPYKYRNYSATKIVPVEFDGETIYFTHLGMCGTSVSFLAIILPIPLLPIEFNKNNCEKSFIVAGIKLSPLYKSIRLDFSKIHYQLKYNNKIYDTKLNSNNSFSIPDFEAFKKAEDKTLIIHKKRDDGTIITKEIPFEWKFITNL